MSTMQKLKAYFGMIPADEVDSYQDDYPEYRPSSRFHREYADDFEEYEPPAPAPRRHYAREEYAEDFEPNPPRRNWQPPRPAPAPTPTRGALAVEPRPEPVTRIRPAAMPQQLPQEPPQREISLSKITTLHLHSYHEARMIGEPYRDGIPVIMNLTEMDDADARRLVDFAAGLAFATRGDIDKITTKVFLVAPPNIDVSAEDKKRLAEGGYYARR